MPDPMSTNAPAAAPAAPGSPQASAVQHAPAQFAPRLHAASTALLMLSDGSLWRGEGLGTEGIAVGELCFNTALSGYQEILTDPSYAAQLITFTFPHIGNVGTTPADDECCAPFAQGAVFRGSITDPSNYRSIEPLNAWMVEKRMTGIAGIDTRALTNRIREKGMPNAVIAHAADGQFDLDAMKTALGAFPGLEGLDLAKEVTCHEPYPWATRPWEWGTEEPLPAPSDAEAPRVVAIDFGAKRNILRELVRAGFQVTVVPATASAETILAQSPDGVFLSNGPGDPAATGRYAVPVIQELLGANLPTFGICLGHQLLGLALRGRTKKMAYGHHGANHPVKDLAAGTVAITSMNHGFTVDRESLPEGVRETHVSLFDGTNCGLESADGQAFSVQFHPEASPGPHDTHGLFDQFFERVQRHREMRAA